VIDEIATPSSVDRLLGLDSQFLTMPLYSTGVALPEQRVLEIDIFHMV
jgi:hypothetical protein